MKRRAAMLLLLVAFSALACAAPARLRIGPRATPTPAASPMPLPSPTPQPTAGPVSLVEHGVDESNPASAYNIAARFPYLPIVVSGAEVFNTAMQQYEDEVLDGFRQNAAQANQAPLEASDSYLQTRTDVLYNQGNLLSLRVWVEFYTKGAAHPGRFARTFTFDLQARKMLALEDLFLPGAGYLPALAAFCQAEILARSPAFWPDGASADPANYRNWNLTENGLLITFDEYQVAPYAAGPQEVMVPFKALEGLLDPQGAAQGLLR